MTLAGASLRFKLSAIIAAVAVFVAVSITGVRTMIRSRELDVELKHKAALYAELLARQLEPAVAFEDIQTARELLESASIDPDVTRIALYSSDGRLLQGSSDPPSNWAADPMVTAVRSSADSVEVAAPVVSHEGPSGLLYLTLSTERMRAQARRALVVSTGLSLGLLFVSVLAAWFVAGWAVRRLARIAAAADRVARGEYTDSHVEPGSSDEIGRLAVGFNAMLARIRTEQERLALLVEERTKELTASREQFRQIAETTRAVPFEYDLELHRFTYVGPQVAELLGYSQASWCEIGFITRVLSADDLAAVREQLSKLAGASADLEVRLTAKDGHPVHVRASANFDGTAVRGLLLDVTERRRLEQDLQQSQRHESVARLASGVAHEINTPVQFSNDSVTFVRDAWGEVMGLLAEYRALAPLPEREQAVDLEYLQENVPKSLDRTLEGLMRIAAIVKSMKAFAQPDQHDKVAYDVNEGLDITLTIAKNEYKYVADVETRLEAAQTINALPGELNQVWLALITNAAQAITDRGDRGTITVRTSSGGGQVRVEISDTGCGIPEASRSRLFEQFYTTRAEGKGKGLGLSNARAVVKQHGGDITFESVVGQGTTFCVCLPADDSAAFAQVA